MQAEAFVMFLYGAQLVKRSSVSGALACLRLVLQSLCDFFPPSGTLLDLSDWAFSVCRSFTVLGTKVAYFSLNPCGEWLSLPA